MAADGGEQPPQKARTAAVAAEPAAVAAESAAVAAEPIAVAAGTVAVAPQSQASSSGQATVLEPQDPTRFPVTDLLKAYQEDG